MRLARDTKWDPTSTNESKKPTKQENMSHVEDIDLSQGHKSIRDQHETAYLNQSRPSARQVSPRPAYRV